MPFPQQRMRRLRRTPALRRLVRETRVTADDLIGVLFVDAGVDGRREVPAMPGVFRLSVDEAVREAEALHAAGIGAVILFGVVPDEEKDAEGTGAWKDDDGIIQNALRAIRRAVPDMALIADTCLCEYTSHGHCGPLQDGAPAGAVDNDAALERIARTAVSQAAAGADIVAPSGMMDGMVQAIRGALDAAGSEQTAILSYAAKFASAFYGPFRNAADSAPAAGDRRQYQMDGANAREAVREALLDEAEGADIIMVKPALAYLDVIARVREATRLPVAAYSVSGEYSMVKAAAAQGWIDERRVVLELITAIKRAGADMILTYWARELAAWLRDADDA